MYCHIHRCQLHRCKCGGNNSKGQGGAFDETKFVEMTQEFKEELKKYTVLLKDEIINHSAGIDYDRLNEKIGDLELRDLKIVGDMNDRINTTVELADLKHEQQDAEIQAAKDMVNALPFEDGTLADTFVTATANGVGTIARTQRDKNSDLVTVKDFGAVGDGVTDDTVAFQKAVAHSDQPFVPDGNYKVDTQQVRIRNFWGIGKVNGVDIPLSKQISDLQVELDGKLSGALGQLTPEYFNVQDPNTLIGNPSDLTSSPKVVGRNEIYRILNIDSSEDKVKIHNTVFELGNFSVETSESSSTVNYKNLYKRPPMVFCQVVNSGSLSSDQAISANVYRRTKSSFDVDVVKSQDGGTRISGVDLLYIAIGVI